MPGRVRLEIAVQDVAGVRVASQVGAARAELCVALGATGGLTPSLGLVEAAVEAALADAGLPERAAAGASAPLEIHPLVRSRAGGFVYDADEIAVQVRDVRAVLAAGASGVVIGALDASGRVDEAALDRLVTAADGAQVTFHRAVDAIADPLGVVERLCALGVTRVLSSGGAARSVDGADVLASMVAQAAGRLQVMAGGGVRVEDVPVLVEAGVDAVHLSAKGFVSDAAGVGGGDGSGYEVTDAAVARAAAEAVRAAG